jgi:hypothetical protein
MFHYDIFQYKTLSITAKTILTYKQEDTIDDIRVAPFWQFFGIES